MFSIHAHHEKLQALRRATAAYATEIRAQLDVKTKNISVKGRVAVATKPN